MWVISNRAWDWRDPVHSVVYGKNQFTSMSVPSDPEFDWKPTQPNDVAIYEACLGAAPAILARQGPDPTLRSHYYDNPKTATSSWFAQNVAADSLNHPLKATIGGQNFYL